MPIYAESVTRAPNHRGRLRLTTVMGALSGAVGRGFDGDGTPPRRGQESGHRRLWWFEAPLDRLPLGTVLIPQATYNAIVEVRERTKPLPPPIVPPRISVEEGLVRATYVERLDSGTAGVLVPPNGARIVLDQWDDELDAILSADARGRPSFEVVVDLTDNVVTAALDTVGDWALSAAPSAYPVHLIYFAETEIGNYTDASRLIPEAN